jgi:competence protein ComEA
MERTRTWRRGLWPLAMLLLLLVAGGSVANADAPPRPGEMVDLNHASERDLVALPGIGPAKAQAILAWRTRNGGFRRIEDLRRVKGFGRKTFRRLRPYLMVTPRSSS